MELQQHIRVLVGLWQDDDLPPWLRGPADGSDLPEPLPEFARAIGRAGALRLAAVLGGTEQLVSAAPEPEDAVCLALGTDQARRLGRQVCPDGDRVVSIPTGPFRRVTIMRQRIRALLLNGSNIPEISREVGATVSSVRRVHTALMRDGQLLGAQKWNERGFATTLNESVILAQAIDLEGLIRDGRPLPDWLLGPDDNSDLPLPLPEIAAVIGRPRALLLSAYLGGARFYLPARMTTANRIARLIGLRDAQRLSDAMASDLKGVELEMPIGPLNFFTYRGWRLRALILTGMPTDQVALSVGVTRRNVNRAKAKLREQGHVIPRAWTPPAVAPPGEPFVLISPPAADFVEEQV